MACRESSVSLDGRAGHQPSAALLAAHADHRRWPVVQLFLAYLVHWKRCQIRLYGERPEHLQYAQGAPDERWEPATLHHLTACGVRAVLVPVGLPPRLAD